MNWSRFALSLPQLIGTVMTAVEAIKGAKGKQKEAAVLQTVKTGFETVELVAGKDLINDPALDELISAYIRSRVALQNFVTKKTAPEGVILPPSA